MEKLAKYTYRMFENLYLESCPMDGDVKIGAVLCQGCEFNEGHSTEDRWVCCRHLTGITADLKKR